MRVAERFGQWLDRWRDERPVPRLVKLSVPCLALAVTTTISAQTWRPAQPIHVIIPYTGGGTADLIARAVSDRLQERLGQPLVIENRAGGSTQIGSGIVARSKPDGETLLLVANTFTINPSLYARLPYDTLKDFEPITYAGVTPHTVVVNNALPVHNLKELVAYAKAHPGKLSYASVGNGTSFHLGTEEFKKRAGIFMVHIPYKGMGPVLTDVMAGTIDVAFANTPNVVPLIKAGKLRAIAIAHPTRVAQLPDVPTFAEQGYPGFTSNSGFLIFAAAGTPPEILDRLNAEFVAALKEPAIRDSLTAQGFEVLGTSRAETAAFVRSEMKKYAELVKFSGATVD
jgi:tripartite-type tricarboxylate transporter receptor subunit TctC